MFRILCQLRTLSAAPNAGLSVLCGPLSDTTACPRTHWQDRSTVPVNRKNLAPTATKWCRRNVSGIARKVFVRTWVRARPEVCVRKTTYLIIARYAPKHSQDPRATVAVFCVDRQVVRGRPGNEVRRRDCHIATRTVRPQKWRPGGGKRGRPCWKRE